MLDIIIPTYNDCDGLRRSLNSLLYEDWIKITVVNDASQDDYSWIRQEYPTVSYIELEINGGPGATRNTARKNSSEPYILFLDCGDIIYSKYLLYEIRDTLTLCPNYYIYGWSWVDIEDRTLRRAHDPSTPGKVYSRLFLDTHQLWQCEGKGSYGGEDMSFNKACWAIIDKLEQDSNDIYHLYNDIPIYAVITNNNSLTHKNNKEFAYKQTPGFIENIIHCITLLTLNNIDIEEQKRIVNEYMVLLYHQFLLGLNHNPDFVSSYWPQLRLLYFKYYKQYESEDALSIAQHIHIKGLMYVNKTKRSPNVRRFIEEIKTNETIPSYYLEVQY